MTFILRTIKFREWQAVAGFTAVLIFLGALPMTAILLKKEPGLVWSGVERISSGDLPVYFSYIEQAKEGNFFLRDLHTSEMERAGTINLFWWVLGQLAHLLGIKTAAIFHASRLIMAPLLVGVLYLLICEFLSAARARIFSLALIIFGSGIGGLVSPFIHGVSWSRDGHFNFPMDLWVPELTVLGGILQSPHLVASWICFALTSLCLIRSFRRGSFLWSIIGGVVGLFFFHFHPYYAPLFWALTIAAAVVFVRDGLEWRRAAMIVFLFFLISIPAVVYHLFLNLSDSVVFARSLQNRTWTTPICLTLISFGLFLPLSATAYKKWKELWQVRILAGWAGLQFLFLYAPIPFQRRFTEGLIIPLSILTVIGASRIFARIKKVFADAVPNKILRNLVFFLMLFWGFGYSNYLLLGSRLGDGRNSAPPTYFEENFLKAIAALSGVPGGAVLSSFSVGNFIPVYTGKRVYAGHWAETIFYEQKEVAVKKFYNGETTDEWRKNFLKKQNISAVFWGPLEQKLGTWDPYRSNFLDEAHLSGNYAIFVVKK